MWVVCVEEGNGRKGKEHAQKMDDINEDKDTDKDTDNDVDENWDEDKNDIHTYDRIAVMVNPHEVDMEVVDNRYDCKVIALR